MEKVSIVIPVYCQWKLVKRNIDALIEYDRDLIEEIIVVDDCSPEKNPYEFNKNLVKIFIKERNLGYTGTVNFGLKHAKCNYIVLLDSDAYPVRPFVQTVITQFNQEPLLGCIGFTTIDEQGNNQGSYQYEPSIAGLISGQFLEFKFGHLRFWRKKNILPYSCAVSFRKLCLEELNYFDEEHFPVLEADNDLSMRIHRSKWKLQVSNNIIICHLGGNSYKVNYKRVMLFHESRWSLLRKHGMIRFPGIAVLLLKARISIEIALLTCLSFNKSRRLDYDEKRKGRKLIMNQINSYR